MSNSKGSSNMRTVMYPGKHPLLPPKSPFPSLSPSFVDYVPNPPAATKAVQRPREGYGHHQRTSSESFLMDEQPSWLDDLLNEPETPVRRGGHRRSSSDSFAYIDVGSMGNLDYFSQGDQKYNNVVPSAGWRPQDFDRQASIYNEPKFVKHKKKPWESPVHASPHPSSGLPSARDNVASQSSGSLCSLQEADRASATGEKQDQAEASPNDSKGSSERKDNSRPRSASSDTDTKRAKQQFAQRSRVRKLQYIAELERNVQALQVEGSEVSAEIGFLNQQHIILSMENKALKQRLESVAQEQLIKYMEHEVLEREIVRLRALYKQQQQQPAQSPSTHQRSNSKDLQRSNSKDLDSQLARLSLKHKDSSSGRVTL